MQSETGSRPGGWSGPRLVLITFLILFVIVGGLFRRSFERDMVAFSNDGPLGGQTAEQVAMPGAFTGVWFSAFWIGSAGGSFPVSPTSLLSWGLGPLGFSKFYVPICILLSGLCALAFFRVLGLGAGLSIVAAIAAALNGNFFSNSCWGLGSRSLALGVSFLAIALCQRSRGNPWLHAALAGLAIGIGVTEAADNGAIFSLYVAAFVVFRAFVSESSLEQRIAHGARVVVVAGFAGLMAAQSLPTLVGFAKTGPPLEQTEQERKQEELMNWNFATQWSLPPAETLRVLIPGLYGYRMDGTNGGNYWGRVGENPAGPPGNSRFSGSGEYAGLLVMLLAAWAIAISFSKTAPFSASERKLIWFWAVLGLVSVLLSWGRFAPFYRLFYELPYASSIRNPMKFMHPAHLTFLILFGYGLLGISRRYLEKAVRPLGLGPGLRSWWAKAEPFERKWTKGLMAVVVISLVVFAMYLASRPSLERKLQTMMPGDLVKSIAAFSINEVGFYVVFLILSSGALILVLSGTLSGARSRWAAVLLGAILTLDLARADVPWILHWNYPYKYATNPVIDILRNHPFEGRVTRPHFNAPEQESQMLEAAGGLARYFDTLYGIEWNQHHFPYYNIQSIDDIQDPRPAADKKAFRQLGANVFRYWQLTNTRYLLSLAGYLPSLNAQSGNKFQIASRFNVAVKPGLTQEQMTRVGTMDFTVVTDPNGPLALFEYLGALPRTKLYNAWEVIPDSQQALKAIGDPAFDPFSKVIVSDAIPGASPVATNHPAASARIVQYKPKRVEITTSSPEPGILLLNDRYDKGWSVTVDNQPVQVLRANFIMRGVQLPAGEHTVLFTYYLPIGATKISLAAYAIGVLLCGVVFLGRRSKPQAESPPTGLSPNGSQPANGGSKEAKAKRSS